MTIGRVSLPNEFFDRTSAKMLRQPEPQYLYARLLYMAAGQAELRRGGQLGISAERAVGGMGAPVMSLEEMQLMLSDEIRAEAIVVSDELAPGKVGHTIRFNRPVFSGGGYTEAARRVSTGQSVSTVPVDLTQEQVALTISRFAGPYDSTNTRTAPRAVDRFDSEHAMHSLADIVGVDLARDRAKWVDTVLGGYFDTVPSTSIVFPGDSTFSLSADSSAFATNVNGSRPFDAETVFRAEQKLSDLNIPRFGNGRYMMILTPQQARQLRSDPAFQREAVFEGDMNPLKNSYIKTLGGIELYYSSTNVVDTSTVSGVSIQHGVAFGPGHIGYASAGPCRIASSTDDNYGETAKVIWLAYEGFAVLDNRMAVSVHSN
jgi:hypothetical protein